MQNYWKYVFNNWKWKIDTKLIIQIVIFFVILKQKKLFLNRLSNKVSIIPQSFLFFTVWISKCALSMPWIILPHTLIDSAVFVVVLSISICIPIFKLACIVFSIWIYYSSISIEFVVGPVTLEYRAIFVNWYWIRKLILIGSHIKRICLATLLQ